MRDPTQRMVETGAEPPDRSRPRPFGGQSVLEGRPVRSCRSLTSLNYLEALCDVVE